MNRFSYTGSIADQHEAERILNFSQKWEQMQVKSMGLQESGELKQGDETENCLHKC